MLRLPCSTKDSWHFTRRYRIHLWWDWLETPVGTGPERGRSHVCRHDQLEAINLGVYGVRGRALGGQSQAPMASLGGNSGCSLENGPQDSPAILMLKFIPGASMPLGQWRAGILEKDHGHTELRRSSPTCG